VITVFVSGPTNAQFLWKRLAIVSRFRIVVATVGSCILFACGDASTRAPASWVGTYRLETINGAGAPWNDVSPACANPFLVDSATLTLGGGPNDRNVTYVAYGKITGGSSACPPTTTIVEYDIYDIYAADGDSLIMHGAFSRFLGGHRSGAVLTAHAGGDVHNGIYQFQRQ